MANAKCPKCGCQKFVSQALDGPNVAELSGIACDGCGVVVGIVDNETQRLVRLIAEKFCVE